MKRIVAGILAHVDSGKTTLSEALLYSAGEIRKKGRVDHGDTFLDTDTIEKERGITIFSKQAILKKDNTYITLLDTPGHVDFGAETERTLFVLDYAILVISGTDGVQSHTKTLWELLKRHNIPVFIFVNKMDISSYTKNVILNNLKENLDNNCIDFSSDKESLQFFESVAMCDEGAMEEFFNNSCVNNEIIKKLIEKRKLFPCFFGSALKQEGVDEFLDIFCEFTNQKMVLDNFGARVFKISYDEQQNRVTHLKVTGKELNVRQSVKYCDKDGREFLEKINSIRVYSSNKFKTSEIAKCGGIYSVTGLSNTYPGQGIGEDNSLYENSLCPVFLYKVKINDNTDIHTAFTKLKKLEEEEAQLAVFKNEQLDEINLRLMGEVQCEVLKRIILEKYDMDIDFSEGGILYKETVEESVEGVGHFEPLRHYAEVHLLIEPNERGKGVEFFTDCSEDILAKNWQRLILTHLGEKTHLGVLTGSELTDVKITLVSGKAHQKHTEGGDFREATYRAVRNGLMRTKSVLLEPWYSFILELPTSSLGRAMTDLERMGATLDAPQTYEDISKLSGKAPVSEISGYQMEVTAYTKGEGKLNLSLCGYEKCLNQDEIVKEKGYNPEEDILNSADSVFCSHGAGFVVKWYDVPDYMHIEFKKEKNKKEEKEIKIKRAEEIKATDEELIRIFESTYGKINHKAQHKVKTVKSPQSLKKPLKKPKVYEKTYLLADGYNIIFASEELSKIAKESLDDARIKLCEWLCDYQSQRGCEVIVVFDAYKVKGGKGEVEKFSNICVVYTKEAQTADAYIEKTTNELSKNNRVEVATSDSLEQIIIMGSGALRISASQFLDDIKKAQNEIRKAVYEFNLKERE